MEEVEKKYADPNLIYHYTSLETLLKIVKSNKLWASDLDALNDPEELIHTRNVLHKLCFMRGAPDVERARNVAFNLSYPYVPFPSEIKPEEQKDYCTLAAKLFELLNPRNLMDEWKNLVGLMYGVSFCAEGDLLSQWRGYGLNGEGVCIAFDKNVMKTCFPNASLVSVDYGLKSHIECIDSALISAFRAWQKLKQEDYDISDVAVINDDYRFLTVYKDELGKTLRSIAHRFKKVAFAEERETRLVFQHESYELPQNLEINVRDGRIVPYIALQPLDTKLPIRSVITGPAFKSANQTYALRAYLKDCGQFDIPIDKSEYSLR